LFLALKNKKSALIVNRIRKRANKVHTPMKEDYLNGVISGIRRCNFFSDEFDLERFKNELEKVNNFRKIKLYQTLKFYNNDNVDGIVYPIRNGKAYVSSTRKVDINSNIFWTIANSLKDSLSLKLKDKKVFMDAELAVPTSEKMFYGDVPFGSNFSTDDALVVGVYWEDTDVRIDLDLSMASLSEKIGWDSVYRSASALFSGDMTAAPKGASESFLIKRDSEDDTFIFNLNFYNSHQTKKEVPYTVFIAKESDWKHLQKSKRKNNTVSRDNMLFFANNTIDQVKSQKVVGVLRIKDGIKTFYLFDLKMDNRITSKVDDGHKKMISYYNNYLDSFSSLKNLLVYCGVSFVETPEEADIDLSLKSITKDKLIDLLVK
jgi:hypothetical protein